jgi:hypothetical protein
MAVPIVEITRREEFSTSIRGRILASVSKTATGAA